jgi:hypothetical protein
VHARRRPFWLGDWSTRALFQPSHDADSYLRGAISGLALKEARRKGSASASRVGFSGKAGVRNYH